MITDHSPRACPAGPAGRPEADDRDVASLVPEAVDRVLDLAGTWLTWDGRPAYSGGNVWTPHRAFRQVAGHLLGHLTEIEGRLAGQSAVSDLRQGRLVTQDSDYARFTEADLDEATTRLTRLAACYRTRMTGLDSRVLDGRPDEGTWTIREIVHHVSSAIIFSSERIDRLPATLS
ncbi:MAG TPA: hypothetical protein VGG25_16615 [Streptosporangiaceae bacterium]